MDESTVSSGEGFPLLARRIPGAFVIGCAGTYGSFGMAGAKVRLPCGLTFSHPNGRSVDGEERVRVDGNDRLEGGIQPDVRGEATRETVHARSLEGRDVALERAVREVLSAPRQAH